LVDCERVKNKNLRGARDEKGGKASRRERGEGGGRGEKEILVW
jgi:hypothetical protein